MHDAALRDTHDSSWPVVAEQYRAIAGPHDWRSPHDRVTHAGPRGAVVRRTSSRCRTSTACSSTRCSTSRAASTATASTTWLARSSCWCASRTRRPSWPRSPRRACRSWRMPSTSTAACTTAWRRAAAGPTTPALGDWWGRALWALGVAAARAPTEDARSRALTAFHRAASARSPHGRAMAFATLGAADVLTARPRRPRRARAGARRRRRRSRSRETIAGQWPEPACATPTRCSPKRCWPAGRRLDNPRIVARGLAMLRFLVGRRDRPRAPLRHRDRRARPRADGRPSSTSSRSRSPRSPTPAHGRSTSPDDPSWRDAVASAWAWFMGDNDASTPMFDLGVGRRIRRTGGGRAQREPRCGVDARGAQHLPAGAAPGRPRRGAGVTDPRTPRHASSTIPHVSSPGSSSPATGSPRRTRGSPRSSPGCSPAPAGSPQADGRPTSWPTSPTRHADAAGPARRERPGRRQPGRGFRAADGAPRRSCSARRSRRSTRSRGPRSATRARSSIRRRTGSRPDELRVAIALRCIGEGHISSIGFAEAVIDADGSVDVRSTRATPLRLPAVVGAATGRAHHFGRALEHEGHLTDLANAVLSDLPERFTVRRAGVRAPRAARSALDASRQPRADAGDARHGGIRVPRRLLARHAAQRTGAASRRRRGEPRHGGRAVRPLHRRRRGHRLSRHLHGVRRTRHRAATDHLARSRPSSPSTA